MNAPTGTSGTYSYRIVECSDAITPEMIETFVPVKPASNPADVVSQSDAQKITLTVASLARIVNFYASKRKTK